MHLLLVSALEAVLTGLAVGIVLVLDFVCTHRRPSCQKGHVLHLQRFQTARHRACNHNVIQLDMRLMLVCDGRYSHQKFVLSSH